MGVIEMNEGLAIAVSIILGTFSLGMMVVGVRWIIRTAKEL